MAVVINILNIWPLGVGAPANWPLALPLAAGKLCRPLKDVSN